jgi:hypothetical protein
MGKDTKHKIEGKCKNGILSWEDAPEELKRKWARGNFSIGEGRKRKKDTLLKDLKKVDEV